MDKEMYIRLKRGKTTIFLHVDAQDTVKEIKTNLADKLQQDATKASSYQLYKDTTQLADDSKSLNELNIGTNDVLGFTCQNEDGSWETLNVIEPEAMLKDDS